MIAITKIGTDIKDKYKIILEATNTTYGTKIIELNRRMLDDTTVRLYFDWYIHNNGSQSYGITTYPYITIQMSFNKNTISSISGSSTTKKIVDFENGNPLSTGNTSSYTPSNDYNPATKKYVDDKPTTYTGYDATKTQVLKNINGTLTWVDEA